MSEVEWSPAQHTQRGTFKSSAAWGRAAFADPATKAAYAARARELDIPIYALIYRDRRRSPCVEAIDLSSYSGKAGQEIRVQVDDAFEGYQVELTIRDGSGTVFEAGLACRTSPEQTEWTYRTTMDLAVVSGILVEAVAKDRPGNRDSRIQIPSEPAAATPSDGQHPIAPLRGPIDESLALLGAEEAVKPGHRGALLSAIRIKLRLNR
jgi:hypothetical protein